MEMIEMAVEHVLATMPHVLLYLPIPNKRIADGHEASRWNVGTPKWQGMLKILVRESKFLLFQFFEFDRTLFLEAKPIPIAEITEDKRLMTFHIPKVIDSSRYFVLRVESPDGKKKFPVGLGFNKRAEAFDFQATLSDFQRMYVKNAVEEFEDDELEHVQYVEKNPDKYKMKDNEVWDPKLKKFVEKKAVDISAEDFAFAPPPMKVKGGKVKQKVHT